MSILHIKNMVCDRCKKVINDELIALGVEVHSIELGVLEIDSKSVDLETIANTIEAHGFELIESKEEILVERIKVFLISIIDKLPIQRKHKLSTMISDELGKDYSSLSKVFSQREHFTIEKYFLRLKLEKVKELIQNDSHSFSQIAAMLDYSSINHLSGQFKQETGLSMSEYKSMVNRDRKPLDKIV
ncbi:helix-turn-helix domain-containing protein [Ekhidna sp.]|uniref:AraC family transcriptional regulator n=1 Tax=Ekhidna sp. TaxID=2608089 RepID=UPI00329A6463